MVIITVFFLFLFQLRFKTYRRPYVIVPEFFISRKMQFSVRCNYSVPRSINHAVVWNAGRSGDLRSELTRDYSKKLSSKETTRFDEENQAYLTADCGRLQVQFTSPHSLSVNGSSGVALGKTIRSQSMVLGHKVANTP